MSDNAQPIDQSAVEAIVRGRHADPFAVLGMHGGGDRPVTVSVFAPPAAEVEVLKAKGYDKTVSLELFNAELWEQDPLDVVSTGLARMKALFA